jgi:hypothetical protein
MQIAKKTFTISVKKFTLTGLKRNFPSTFDIYTSIGCIKRAEFQMSTLFTYLFSPLLSSPIINQSVYSPPRLSSFGLS